MLSSLANYLLGGNISDAQDSRQESNNETPESHPVIARLSQVEIEGDDWILIDRAGTFNERDKRSFPKGISRNSNIYIYIYFVSAYTYIYIYVYRWNTHRNHILQSNCLSHAKGSFLSPSGVKWDDLDYTAMNNANAPVLENNEAFLARLFS